MLRVKPQLTLLGLNTLRVAPRVTPVCRVKAGREPYHKVGGWRFEKKVYKGRFRVGNHYFPGELWNRYGTFGATLAYLPEAVLSGDHGACFSPDPRRKGWWKVHFAKNPKSVDGAILAVEQSIRESL